MHFSKLKKNETTLSRREDFILDVFHKLIEIENKIKDLDFSISFITVTPGYSPWKKKMTRKEYIVYHLEYYYISIISLFDRILHLVNYLYNLGLSDSFVTMRCISTNTNVPKEIKVLLDKIDKSFSNIRGLQNSVKHKKKLRITELYNAELLEFNLRNENLKMGYSKANQKELASDMKYFYKVYLIKKAKEMRENNKAIERVLEIFLDKLYFQYKKRLEIIEQSISRKT